MSKMFLLFAFSCLVALGTDAHERNTFKKLVQLHRFFIKYSKLYIAGADRSQIRSYPVAYCLFMFRMIRQLKYLKLDPEPVRKNND